MLLDCKDPSSVNDTSKEELAREDCPLDRPHLEYLLKTDPEMKEVRANSAGVPIFITTIEYSFGLLHRTNEQILKIDAQMKEF